MVLFALSCAGLLLFLWLSFGGTIPFNPQGYRFKVSFQNADQLATQADVRIAGVSVGRVIDKSLDPQGNRTIATIQMDKKYSPVHVNGRAILYADKMTASMKAAIDETLRRRAIQHQYNIENNITPTTIMRPLDYTFAGILDEDVEQLAAMDGNVPEFTSQKELDEFIGKLELEMRDAARIRGCCGG